MAKSRASALAVIALAALTACGLIFYVSRPSGRESPNPAQVQGLHTPTPPSVVVGNLVASETRGLRFGAPVARQEEARVVSHERVDAGGDPACEVRCDDVVGEGEELGYRCGTLRPAAVHCWTPPPLASRSLLPPERVDIAATAEE